MNDEIRRLAEEVKRATGMSLAEFQKAVATDSDSEYVKRLADDIKKATGGMTIAEFQKAATAVLGADHLKRIADAAQPVTMSLSDATAAHYKELEEASVALQEQSKRMSTALLPVLDPPQLHLPAKSMRERLLTYIKEFEQELDDEHEIGARLVSFGQAVTFHVERVGYYGSDMISFYGRDERGQAVQLVQHYMQLSVLLVAVKKQGEKPRRIGFLTDEKN